ncbi:hypothetical protein [Streptomyces sp. NPDC055107]
MTASSVPGPRSTRRTRAAQVIPPTALSATTAVDATSGLGHHQ